MTTTNDTGLWKIGSHAAAASGDGSAAAAGVKAHLGSDIESYPVKRLYNVQDEWDPNLNGPVGVVICPTGQVPKTPVIASELIKAATYPPGIVIPACIHVKPNGMVPSIPENPQTLFLRKPTPSDVSVKPVTKDAINAAIHTKPKPNRQRLIAELHDGNWLLVEQPTTNGH